MTDGGDLSDVAVVAHVLQNRLAAITGATGLLQDAEGLSDEIRDDLIDVVSRSAAALAELQPGDGTLPKMGSGEERPFEARLAALELRRLLELQAG